MANEHFENDSSEIEICYDIYDTFGVIKCVKFSLKFFFSSANYFQFPTIKLTTLFNIKRLDGC